MRKLLFALTLVLVIAVVVAIGGLGVALALENQDAFCTSCHTEPEVTFYQQSIQERASTLAAFHRQKQTACIDCHSGAGIFGRRQGLQQGAHDLASFLSGNYNQPAITTNPLGDDSCIKCHLDAFAERRTESRAMNGHYHSFLPRWQSVDQNAARCTSCHSAHTKGLESLAFMAQGKVARVCDDCHTALSGDIR